MPPVSLSFKRLQQRLRRSLCYGSRQMKSLPLPLSELAVDYFDRHFPYDHASLDSATSLSCHGYVDACTFLIAMVYLDRVRAADKTCFESFDSDELYLSALVIASKYIHDVGQREFIYNDEWATLANISLKRVNEIELNVLDAVRWNINVSHDEFIRVLNEVEAWVARDSLKKRGFCTYNEIAVLLSKSSFISDCFKPLILSLVLFAFVYSTVIISLLMFPQIAISACMQRNLMVPNIDVLSVNPTVDNMMQQKEAIFSVLHSKFYEWFTSHIQCVSRTGLMSNVAISCNKFSNQTAYDDDTLTSYSLCR